MKKTVLLFLPIFIISILFTACGFSSAGGSSQSTSQESSSVAENFSSDTQSEAAQAEIDLAHDTLESYLNDCWGYRESTHDLSFDTIIQLENAAFYAFKVYSATGEYEKTFAISMDQKTVYLFDEATDQWLEDKNPEPWDKW